MKAQSPIVSAAMHSLRVLILQLKGNLAQERGTLTLAVYAARLWRKVRRKRLMFATVDTEFIRDGAKDKCLLPRAVMVSRCPGVVPALQFFSLPET